MKLELAHVLFIDIVRYSKLLITEQRDRLEALKKIVQETATVRASEGERDLIRLPTGDGMALVFRGRPEAPVECAIEISEAAREYRNLPLRMGIHSGPVHEVRDVNERANVAGAGIDLAQRVMDCGDAGHILVSRRVADDLAPYPRWHAHLHDLGETEVKHGARVHLFNLYTGAAGNSETPAQLRPAAGRVLPPNSPRPLPVKLGLAALGLLLLAGGSWWFISRQQPTATSTTAAAPESIVAAPEKSIAVLPFDNLSSDKENAYFAGGVQDEILTRLAKVGTLKVISRTSTERYQSAPRNLAEIARQLGVATLLEGSVQKANQKVRINVQLIKANDSSHLWAETYDRRLDDIFAVESEVATAIAEKLRATLSGRERALVNARPTENLEAYDAYLHGSEFDRRSESQQNLQEASGYLEKAVQLDPKFALAWARLSQVKSNLFYQDFDATPPVRAAAQEAAEKARQLAPDQGEPLLTLGYFQLFCERNLAKARAAFEAARERLPNDSDLLYGLSLVDLHQGKATSALALQNQALLLDPRNALLSFKKAQTLSALRRFEEAREAAQTAIALDPDDITLQAFLANTYQAEGNLEKSAQILDAIPTSSANLPAIRMETRLDLFRGHFADAAQRVSLIVASHENEDNLWTIIYYFWLGEAQHYAGDEVAARQSFTRGRERALANIAKTGGPQGRIHAVLGLLSAGLGLQEEALREAHRAVELEGNDLFLRPAAEEILARVEVEVGDPQRALEILPRLLSANGFSWVTGPVALTPALLRLDPIWRSLRSHPRFVALTAER